MYDTRKFVIVKKKDRLWLYWGTPQHSPKPSSRRNGLRFIPSGREVQENCFKRMIDHGALDVNYGIKKIDRPDRHHERAVKKLEEKEKKALKKLEKKEGVAEAQRKKVDIRRKKITASVWIKGGGF